jgi:uncharacterized membrane protein YqhA
MFWIGGVKLVEAVGKGMGASDLKLAIGSIMAATDAFLFGIVLMVFAFGIAFGFVIELEPEDEKRLPHWMRVRSLSDLKHRLVEVILLFLIVDFATDWVEQSSALTWESLVKPLAILLIASTTYLMARSHPERPH